MPEVLLIGTRDSKLALYQANLVKDLLEKEGQRCELVPVKSDGDTNLTTPLYEMGVQGIFTKNLDAALLEKRIDIGVHSMKDVPVKQARGLTECAVLERDSPYDICVFNSKLQFDKKLIIGSSSLRRKAQWLSRYPHHEIKPIRGNVQTRLRKLEEGEFDAVIFAEAGLDRLDIKPENHIRLDWMLPAPAQGTILVNCRADDKDIYELCGRLTHKESYMCTNAERQFLSRLEAGCTAPVGAHAEIDNGRLKLKGILLNPEGTVRLETSIEKAADEFMEAGVAAADELITRGAFEI